MTKNVLKWPSCTFYATVNSKIGKRFNGKGRQKSYSVDTNHREVLVILLF